VRLPFATVEAYSIFAITAPGLERVVADELGRFGIRAMAVPGGAAWDGPAADVGRANLELRTASRIVVRAGEFRARTFHELERKARRIEWDRFVAHGETVGLRVTCRKSALYHEGAVSERILEAIEAAAGSSGPTAATENEEDDGAADQLFVVRMFRDVCTISADASGERLHRRGYREAVAKAPLRETIAAAMLRASGWEPALPLLDPLCGSGTIAIEAALMARGIAPGLARSDRLPRAFRFLDWPAADTRAWQEQIEQAKARIRPYCPAPILASDRDAGAVRAANENAARAGITGDIEFSTQPLSSVRPGCGAGWIITNPPYGKRVGSRGAAGAVLRELERHVSTDLRGWGLAALVPARMHGSRAAFETRNGGIAVSLRIIAGLAGEARAGD